MNIFKQLFILIVHMTLLVDITRTQNITTGSTSGSVLGITNTNIISENTTSGPTSGSVPGITNTNIISENTTSGSTSGSVQGITNTNIISENTTSGSTSESVPGITNGNNGSNASTSAGNQLPKYLQDLMNFVQNPKTITAIQEQIGNFIKSNNVSLPISVMSPENLQKLLQVLGSGSNTNNLQGISQLAGMLGNISNTIQNVTEELEQGVSPQCFSHLQHLVSELTRREQWALKMIDAAGKIPSGLLDGNTLWTGSYDECLAVQAGMFDGKYCQATIPLTSIVGALVPKPGGFNVQMGICMPDSCASHDVQIVLNTLLGLVPLGQAKLQAYKVDCAESAEIDVVGIAGFTVCGVFLVLMVLSTWFDVMYSRHQNRSIQTAPIEKDIPLDSKTSVNGVVDKPTTPRQPGVLARLAMSFSVYTNGQKLMSTDQPRGALGAINGIRFLSISWVVLGHAFSFSMQEMQNPVFTRDFLGNWSSMVLANGFLSVDSFFTLSGLLVSYLFMKEMKREKGRINWFMFYFHRFWRLTPPYMLMLFIDMSLFRYLGDGPFWIKEGQDGKFCRSNWWTNILYINNVVNSREMCFSWSWYLANDMQFYVVSPLLLVPLYFSKKIGLAVNILALLGITIATAVVSGYYELLPTFMSTDAAAMMTSFDHYFFDYYIMPWCRMGPYIVGIVSGYILYRTNGKFKISKMINLMVWLGMALAACVVLYGIYGPVVGQQWENSLAALFNAVHRSVWGVCVSWVIFACVTGNGGIINDFLSWKLFVPLGRLSYCIYLTHPLVIYYYLQTLRQPFYGTTLGLTFTFLASLVLSVLVSIVASLAFEAPMMSLEKTIFRRGRK